MIYLVLLFRKQELEHFFICIIKKLVFWLIDAGNKLFFVFTRSRISANNVEFTENCIYMHNATFINNVKVNSRGNLRSRKGDRDGRRRERNDSSRSAIHKRLLIPNRGGAFQRGGREGEKGGRVGVAATSSGHCNVKRPSLVPLPQPRSSYDQVCYLVAALSRQEASLASHFLQTRD